MKNSTRLKIVAGGMLLYGALAMVMTVWAVQGRIPAGPHYRPFLIGENIFLAAGNILLGLVLFRPGKGVLAAAAIFATFCFFLYLAKLTFFGGLHFIILQIFYAFVVCFVLLAIKESKQKR